MKNNLLILVLGAILLNACSKKTSTPGNQLPPPSTQHISVLTQHNDNTRAGLNSRETELTTANVNSAQFGRLFTLTVDDEVYSQPLVVGNLSIGSSSHNVIFIATVNNSVYAFDGDNGGLYWTKNFTAPGMRPPNWGDMASGWCNPYTNFTSNIGIVGTPVIDSVSQTIYFVARSVTGSQFYQHLHAVDITTGT